MPNNWIVDDIHELANDILLQSQGGDVFPDMSGYVGVYNTGNGLLAFASGNPVTVSNAKGGNALGVTATLEPIQDFNGYDHQWAGGAGKNKLPVLHSSTTVNGVTFTVASDGTITASGTATADAEFAVVERADNVAIPLGSYILSGMPSDGSATTFRWNVILYNSNGTIFFDQRNGSSSWNITLSENAATSIFRIRIVSGYTANNLVFKPMLRLASETDETFEPYSNICPITGRTQVEITNKDSEDAVLDSVTVNLGQTVYGGSLNVTTGELTVETANIASYNGESIGEPWWSSMDEYEAGTTPTTGAQVVYTLATPTTVSLTPAQIQLLTTTNIISTSADDLEVTYKIRS